MKIIKKIILSFILLFILTNKVNAYYEAPVDITTMDIYELQEAIDGGYLTYELLTRLYLDRIETYDNKFNAIISINENAIDEAKKCDIEYQAVGRKSILYCIPIIVKDNIDVKGMPTTAGAKALSDSIPYNDSIVVQRLKEKGMIVLAKSNMSEFAFMASSSNSSYGNTKNAYNTNYSSYGSSGGSAVSVSLQYAPVALGTDTNSSLRAPASANGVIGFRSTFGLIDTTGILAYDITRDVVGPLTKTVKENALLLETMANKKEGTYTNFKNSTLKDKNIVVLDQFAYGDDTNIYGTGSTYSEIKTLFDEALEKMENEGANIIHLKNFYTKEFYQTDQKVLGGWTMCYAFNNYIKNTSSKIKSFKELSSSKGHIYSLKSYADECKIDISTVDKNNLLKEDYRKFVESIIQNYQVDAFIYPTTKNKVSKIGQDNFESSSYTISPILGLPSVSVPLGFDKDGLMYGIEFVGKQNDESTLYNIIYEFEKINNVYELSTLAPSLYEIPENVIRLKEYYENNKSTIIINLFNTEKIEIYKKSLYEIEQFFLNYNDYENKDETSYKLLNEYKLALENLDNNTSIVILVLIIFVTIFIVLKIFKIRKTRRKRKSKH